MAKPAKSKRPSMGGPKQASAKQQLLKLMLNPPGKDEDLLANVALYMRSVMLAKTLYLNEIYEMILPLPGVIMEFGVWWGTNMSLFNNLRAVYEPYNANRKVIGFDTFGGYAKPTKKDGKFHNAAAADYDMPKNYEKYLEHVLQVHESDNVLDHIKKFEIVKGPAPESLGRYLTENPQTIVALAYLDMALYEPTKRVLEKLKPHFIKGSVLAMDDLGSADFPGETRAFDEVFGLGRYHMQRSRYLPDRTIVVIDG